jgi:hypothetical protein
MKCENCNQKITTFSNFCGNCGSKLIYKYNPEIFTEIYTNLSGSFNKINENKYLSDYYKKYLYKLYNQKSEFIYIMKSFNILGYTTRLTEEYFGEFTSSKLPNDKIDNSTLDKFDKIIKTVEFIDSQTTTREINKDFIKKYSIIDWEESRGALIFLTNDFIKNFAQKFEKNDEQFELFTESAFISASDGYVFRVIEKLIDNKK